MSSSSFFARFETMEGMTAAIRTVRGSSTAQLEAFTPFPSDELDEALGLEDRRVALLALIGGVSGGTFTFFIQWYAMAVSYPINVGGRPLFSWPAFIPITFEITVLSASITAVVSMFVLNRLPRLHHPVFDVPQFEDASRDAFYLQIWVERAEERGEIESVLKTHGGKILP